MHVTFFQLNGIIQIDYFIPPSPKVETQPSRNA